MKARKTIKEVAKTAILAVAITTGTIAALAILGDDPFDQMPLSRLFLQKLFGFALAFFAFQYGRWMQRRNLAPEWWKQFVEWSINLGEEEDDKQEEGE